MADILKEVLMVNNLTNVLLIGASGFIGQNLKRYLFSDNFNITLTYNNSILHDNCFTVIQKDLTSNSFYKDFVNLNPDIVINCAGLNPTILKAQDEQLFYKFNRDITVNLAYDFLKYSESTKSHTSKKFLNLSTYEIYGNINSLKGFKESSKTNPLNAYADSKAQAVNEIEKIESKNVFFTNIICTNNYGPGQSNDKLIPVVFNKLIKNQKIIIKGDGSSQRTWTFVKDTCEGIIQALKNGNHKRFHLSSNNHVSVIGVIKSIHNILKSQELISTDSARLIWHEASDNPVFRIDSSWSEKVLNWNANTSFLNGLEQTIQHLRAQPNEK